MGVTVLFPLGKADVDSLGDDEPSVHFSDGPCGLLRRREAHETDSFGASLHDHGGGDGSVRSEQLKETLISDGVVQVLDIQIDALECASLNANLQNIVLLSNRIIQAKMSGSLKRQAQDILFSCWVTP